MKNESEKKILGVLQGKTYEIPPVWFMRQAGRYLPEYRELRAKKNGFLDMAYDPIAASEITMQPIRRFSMDAAIIFSDILVIPHALGQELWFEPGVGPRLGEFNFKNLNEDKFDEILQPVFDALTETRRLLKSEGFDHTTLIGFAGAPWTVITYMLEGGSSKDFKNTKALAYGDPESFGALMDLVVKTTARYLSKQVEAGAEVLQIFDSWSGALDPHGFQYQCIEPTKKIVNLVKANHPNIPIIGFPKGGDVHRRAYVEQTGIDAIGVDTITCPKWAANNLQDLVPVQGNLDPMRLLAGGEGLEKATRKIIRDFSGGGHIFNLGHGINKETPIDHVHHVLKVIRDE